MLSSTLVFFVKFTALTIATSPAAFGKKSDSPEAAADQSPEVQALAFEAAARKSYITVSYCFCWDPINCPGPNDLFDGVCALKDAGKNLMLAGEKWRVAGKFRNAGEAFEYAGNAFKKADEELDIAYASTYDEKKKLMQSAAKAYKLAGDAFQTQIDGAWEFAEWKPDYAEYLFLTVGNNGEVTNRNRQTIATVNIRDIQNRNIARLRDLKTYVEGKPMDKAKYVKLLSPDGEYLLGEGNGILYTKPDEGKHEYVHKLANQAYRKSKEARESTLSTWEWFLNTCGIHRRSRGTNGGFIPRVRRCG